MKRSRRFRVLAGYLVVGSIVTQAGACWTIGANSLAPGIAYSLVDDNGRLFGLVNVCGIPNVLEVDQSGGNGELFNEEDDLVTVCPYTVVVQQSTTGGGGTGGGGV